jgi:hypothetical protein
MEPEYQSYLVILLDEDLDQQGRYSHIAKLSASITRDNEIAGKGSFSQVVVVEGVSDCDLKTTLAECYMDDLPVEYNTHTNLTTGRSLRFICSLAFLVDKSEWDEYWEDAVSGMGWK